MEFVVNCPHCNSPIIIVSVNCGIFRHGQFKLNGEQVPPHSSRDVCDMLIEKDLVYGCCKPFKISVNSDQSINIELSDYI